MRFHICNIEPNNYRYGHFLDDFCRLVCFSLESLGHTCSMGCNQLEPDRVNIIFGGHMLSSVEQVEAIAQSCKYIAVQHEILNSDGVNLSKNMAHFRNVYLPFLQRAIGVWEGIPRNVPVLERLGLKAGFFRGGYHPAMEEVRHKPVKDIDFLFYGSITPYRRHMLELLGTRGHMVVAVFDVRASYRNDLIARAKVNVAPIQGPGMEHFAYGRVCYLINNRALVVVQQCEDQQWLESTFVTASEEQWVDVCHATLCRPDRDSLVESFVERFRAMPFTRQVEGLLEATLSSGSSAGPGLVFANGFQDAVAGASELRA